jgi:cytochrome c peroxidase
MTHHPRLRLAKMRTSVHGLAQVVHLVALPLTMACSPPLTDDLTLRSRLPPQELGTPGRAFEPIPRSQDLDPRRVELGRRLFSEPLLSGDGTRRCVDCHDLKAGGVVPGEARSNHPLSQGGPYNVPTVFNVGFNFRYNWQGQFETLEAHLSGPMLSATVMDAGSWPEVTARLTSYEPDFIAAGYPRLSEEAVQDAIVTFQRSLITPDSRFDQFLRGDLALESLEMEGYTLFREVGCATCHQGINLGGNMFQRFGVVESPYDRPLVEKDYGRMMLTGEIEDEYVFRVPSLRNIALTAPYFHDGSATTLDAAVQRMARVQLGYRLSPDESAALVAFLHTLTGTYQGEPLSMGVL